MKTSFFLKPSESVVKRDPPVPIRHVDFGFGKQPLPRYFYDNDPVASTFYMAFSLVIPQGERFFIQSVRYYREYVKDPELQARITGFIGQEAIHGREHDAANAAYDEIGFPREPVERVLNQFLATMGRLPRPVQLAFTVALEHFTAIISDDTVSSRERREKFAPQVRNFMLWHMMEEMEHKAVAYDVYRHSVGSYAVRVGTMLPVAVGLFPVLFAIQLYLLQADGRLRNLWRHRKGLAAIYGPRGLFARITPALLDYFKPGFHPNHHDSQQMLETLRQELFGSQGLLNANLSKTVIPKAPPVATFAA